MKVSVIVTSYNQKKYLIQTIGSILAQTAMPFEIIICDDYSKDASRDVIKYYQREYPNIIKPVFQTRNLGVTINRNTGIKLAKGDFISTLDGDDLYYPQKLEKELKKLRETNAPLVYSNVVYIDENGDETGLRYKKNMQKEGCLFEAIATLKYPAPREVLIARNCIEQIGYPDENLKINEDFDWIVRLASRFEFSAVNEPLVKHRYHAKGLHRSDRLLLLETLETIAAKSIGLTGSCIENNKQKTLNKLESFLNLSKARVHQVKGNYQDAREYLLQSISQDWRRSSGYDLLMRLYMPKMFKRSARLPDSLMLGPFAAPFYLLRGVF